MEKNIQTQNIIINGINYSYKLTRSYRKSVSIQVAPGGQINVHSPCFVPLFQIEDIIRDKGKWLASQYEKQLHVSTIPSHHAPLNSQEKKQRQEAKQIIEDRVRFYCQILHCDYTSISIRDTTSRWGSCSAKGNLSFSWRLTLAPDYVLNYVVVHELCHRTYMNHSKEFWSLVSSVMPNYKICRSWLKNHGHELFNS